MKRGILIVTILAAAGIATFHPTAVHAAPPTMQTELVNTSDLLPAGSLCDFDVTFTGIGTVTVTTFYDAGGNPIRQTIHGALLHTLLGPGRTLSTNGPAPVHIDLITGTSTDTGNEYHFNLAG